MRNIFARGGAKQTKAPESEEETGLTTVPGLRRAGFEGFVSVGSLRESDCAAVPEAPGVYVMLLPDGGKPRFLPASPAARLKGEDATVSIVELEENWVPDTALLYVGKAGGRGSTATLKARIRQYLDFGRGRPVGHRVGRYVWQLAGSSMLILCWKATEDSAVWATEAAVLDAFRARHGTLPFANLLP